MNVGEKIKLRRKELKISADDLADAVGVSRSTIFRYEKGDIERRLLISCAFLPLNSWDGAMKLQ